MAEYQYDAAKEDLLSEMQCMREQSESSASLAQVHGDSSMMMSLMIAFLDPVLQLHTSSVRGSLLNLKSTSARYSSRA